MEQGNVEGQYCELCKKLDTSDRFKNKTHECNHEWNKSIVWEPPYKFKYLPSQEIRDREKDLNERVKDFEYKLELQCVTAYGNQITVKSILEAVIRIKQRRIEGLSSGINPVPTFLPGGYIKDLALCAEQDREMIYNSLGVQIDMMDTSYMGLTNNLPEVLKKINKPSFRNVGNYVSEIKRILKK